MLEPSDSAECKDYAKLAYEISEQFDTPVVLRLTTRVSHSRSLVELGERQELDLKPYEKNPQKNVMLPAMAKKKHVIVEQRTRDLAEYAETSGINRVEMNSTKIGVITSRHELPVRKRSTRRKRLLFKAWHGVPSAG